MAGKYIPAIIISNNHCNRPLKNQSTVMMRTLPDIMFITGIGTDVGKSYATGWLARELAKCGRNVITQKFIQTGNKEYSEDIEIHRQVMGIGMQPRDLDHTTAPLILSYPASPDLAAKIDGINVDFEIAARSTDTLHKEYDTVLIEGAGGVMVPLKGNYLTIDYVADHNLPAVVVTNGQLGSINHTLLTLQVLKERNIKVAAVVYNPYFDKDQIICTDTKEYIQKYLATELPGCLFLTMPTQV